MYFLGKLCFKEPSVHPHSLPPSLFPSLPPSILQKGEKKGGKEGGREEGKKGGREGGRNSSHPAFFLLVQRRRSLRNGFPNGSHQTVHEEDVVEGDEGSAQ